MKKLLTTSLLLLSLLTYTQAAGNEKPLAEMTMTDITGKTYDVMGTEQGLKIKGLEGKVIFLEFFGHRCPPCLESIPHLIKLQKKYKNKLAIVSIEVQGYNHEQTKKFAKENGMNYIVCKSGNDESGNEKQVKGIVPHTSPSQAEFLYRQ